MRSRRQLKAIFAAMALREQSGTGAFKRYGEQAFGTGHGLAHWEKKFLGWTHPSDILDRLRSEHLTNPSTVQKGGLAALPIIHVTRDSTGLATIQQGEVLTKVIKDMLARIPSVFWRKSSISGIVFASQEDIQDLHQTLFPMSAKPTAFYDAINRTVYVPTLDPKAKTSLHAQAMQARVLLHELSHALDFAVVKAPGDDPPRSQTDSWSDRFHKDAVLHVGGYAGGGFFSDSDTESTIKIRPTSVMLKYAESDSTEKFAEMCQW